MIINDPFEQLLSEIIQEIAEEMKNLQSQDLTFHPDMVQLEQKQENMKLERGTRQ